MKNQKININISRAYIIQYRYNYPAYVYVCGLYTIIQQHGYSSIKTQSDNPLQDSPGKTEYTEKYQSYTKMTAGIFWETSDVFWENF